MMKLDSLRTFYKNLYMIFVHDAQEPLCPNVHGSYGWNLLLFLTILIISRMLHQLQSSYHHLAGDVHLNPPPRRRQLLPGHRSS